MMNKNKIISFKRKCVDCERKKTSTSVLQIQKGTWPNVLADIYCLPDKFEDSIILYKGAELFVFTNASVTLAPELKACIEESHQNLTLESIGVWSVIYDNFLIYRQKDKSIYIMPKVDSTTNVFDQLEDKLASITVYINLVDILSKDNAVHKVVYHSIDVRHLRSITSLIPDDSKSCNVLMGISKCPPGQISLKSFKKVIPPTSALCNSKRVEPLFKEVPANNNFPEQVSEEQSSSERSEFAFSSGLSLPFATDQASSFAHGSESLSGNSSSHVPPPRYPDYAEYNDRLRSYERWMHRHPDSVTLSKAGFFYTKNGDLVRCHHCGIGLKDFTEGDDPLKEHVRHSGKCPYLVQVIGPSRLAEWKRQLQVQEPLFNPQMQVRGQQNVTCKYRHPEYQTVEARLETFTTWPAQVIQTPSQLAEAGLYYTGFEDHVRCFACDGGLRRWDPGDDPWTEHCRWFPACPYAKEKKGEEYIALVQAAVAFENEASFEDHVRCFACDGGLRRWDPGDDPWTEHCRWFPACPYAKEKKGEEYIALVQAAVAFENEDNNTLSSAQSHGQDLVGAMEQMTLRDPEFRAALNEHKDTCLEMGYQIAEFNEAVQELRNRGSIKPTIEEIIDVIEVIKARKQQDSMLQTRNNETPVEENRRLKSLITCMSCGKSSVNALFLPCTHHRLCMDCAEPLTHCPVCERYIRQKIRTYLV